MATFEDIRKANETIRTTDIKGKDYAEVHQRIKAFRMVYPEGFIMTHIITDENGKCIFKATVGFYDDEGNANIIGTGTAYEKENTSYINKTSYLENCETSAVGRALGMAGFGIDTSVASAEEVSNAIYQQDLERAKQKKNAQTRKDPDSQKEKAEPGVTYATAEERHRLIEHCKTHKIDMGWLAEKVGIKDKMTAPQFAKAMGIVNDIIAKKESATE